MEGLISRRERYDEISRCPFHLSTFCCVFIGFTDLFICFWKVQHMHPVKRISFFTPDHDPDDKKIFGYVCS